MQDAEYAQRHKEYQRRRERHAQRAQHAPRIALLGPLVHDALQGCAHTLGEMLGRFLDVRIGIRAGQPAQRHAVKGVDDEAVVAETVADLTVAAALQGAAEAQQRALGPLRGSQTRDRGAQRDDLAMLKDEPGFVRAGRYRVLRAPRDRRDAEQHGREQEDTPIRHAVHPRARPH